jgi:hypothetical protein
LLLDQSELIGDNLNDIKREANRHFINEVLEYLKDKINVLAMESKNARDQYRGINVSKKSFRPRSDLVKDKNSDLLQIPTF